ncbi:hypothetical protein ACWCPM_20600 [Streptomyces sp. NPDC002309]
MVSSPHEAMHRIFQQEPALFARSAQASGYRFGDTPVAHPLPTDLTETRPLERRVDTLLRMETASGDFILAVEAQERVDLDKPASWAYYMAHLYAKYKLPPLLLVVTRDRKTATWASRPMHIGPPQWPTLMLQPFVLGPEEVPVIDDPEEAARDVPMAVLSAIVHSRDADTDAILKALAAALRGLETRDPENAAIYTELTAQGLGEKNPAAELWRDLVTVDTSFFTSPLSQEIRAEGQAEGRADSRAEDTLRILDRRGIPVSDADRERITTCTDLDTLTRWFDRAITAASADEVFADDGSGAPHQA